MAANGNFNSSQLLVSEIPSSHPPPLTTQNQSNNPSKSYLNFIFKSLLVSIVLVIIPLFPTTSPQFVNQTIPDRSWELIHLLFVGIAVSYGLFCHLNFDTHHNKQNHFEIDNTQTYMSRILQVSSVFNDFHIENHNGSDENLFQTWNSQNYRGQSTVLVAEEEEIFSSNNGSSFKPLLLPVRSLRSQVLEPNVVESVKEQEEESIESSGYFRADSAGNIIRNVDGEKGDLSSVDCDGKFNGNSVLPSPIPWRSRSGRMNEQVNYPFLPSVQETESLSSPNYLSFESNSTFSHSLQKPSISSEFLFENVNETVSFQPYSSFHTPLETPSPFSPEFHFESTNRTMSFQPNSAILTPPVNGPTSPEYRFENVNTTIALQPTSEFLPTSRNPSISSEFRFENAKESVPFQRNCTFPPRKISSHSQEHPYENEERYEKKKKKNPKSCSLSPADSLSPSISPTRYDVNENTERGFKYHNLDLSSGSNDLEPKLGTNCSSMMPNSEVVDHDEGISRRTFRDQKNLTRSQEDLEMYFSNSDTSHHSSFFKSSSYPIGDGFSTKKAINISDQHFSKSGAKSKTRIEHSPKGRSVRTVKRSDSVGETRKVKEVHGDQFDESTGIMSNEVEETLMEETRKKHEKKVYEKVIVETGEYSDTEIDETQGSLVTQTAKSDIINNSKCDSNEVDKKADEFIAKFREQIHQDNQPIQNSHASRVQTRFV